MKNILCFLLIGLLLAGCYHQPTLPPLPSSLPPTPTSTPEVIVPTEPASPEVKDVADYLQAISQAGMFSGAVFVESNGSVVINQGFGLADREQKIPLTSQTRFPVLPGLGDSFTAAAILLLESLGKLNVQDTICQYFTDCPEDWQDITIHHLLSSTSGIPDYVPEDHYFYDGGRDYDNDSNQPADQGTRQPALTGVTPDQLLASIIDKPLEYQPGERCGSSGSNMLLLGLIIEQASDQSYASFLQENFFTPLGMESTGFNPDLKLTAIGYSSITEKAHSVDLSSLYPNGGLYSTIEDLHCWNKALREGNILPPEQVQAMFTSQPSQNEMSCGYGWFVGQIEGNAYAYGVGYIPGYMAFNILSTGTNLIILSNLTSNQNMLDMVIDRIMSDILHVSVNGDSGTPQP